MNIKYENNGLFTINQYQLIADHIADAIIITDINFNITGRNNSAANTYSFSDAEIIIGKNLFELLFPQYSHTQINHYKKQAVTQGSHTEQTYFVNNKGEKVYLHLTIIYAEEGFIIITRPLINNNIAESKITPALATNDNWRSVVNNSKTGFFLLDRAYTILLVNEYGKKMLCHTENTEQDFEGTNFLDILPEERKAPAKNYINRSLSGERIEYEVDYSALNGKDLWLLVSYSPVKGIDGSIQSVCITVNNITKHKLNEAALIKSEQRWKFALDGAGDGVWEYNLQTNESYYSALYKKLLGFTEEEFKDAEYDFKSRVHPDDVYLIADIDNLYKKGVIENHSVEYRVRNKEGNYLWVLDRGMLLERDKEGNPLILIGTQRNITERKIADEKFIKSQQRFFSFMENTPTMCWIIDENAVFRYLNAPYIDAFKLSKKDIGKSVYDIFPKNICETFVENNWKVWDSGKAIEAIEEGVGPGGEKQFYQIFKFPLDTENGIKLLGGVALDITKKRLLEEQLAAEENKQKREIIQAIINAQEKERRELAYELHDNVNQILSSSKLMLEVAVEKPEAGKDFVKRSLHYLQDAISEIRKLSHNLTPGTLQDISLEEAIEEVVHNINVGEKLIITYNKHIQSGDHSMQAEIQLSVLRIAQEQLNNILKHAGATHASVDLMINNQKVILTVQDNGNGFNTLTTKKGLGLNNIFNRVAYYHGITQLISSEGKGCTLKIEIPLQQS